MSDAPNPADVARELAEHPHLSALTGLVRRAALGAAAARRSDFASRHGSHGASVPPLPEGMTREDANTSYGNVLDVLDRGVTSPRERELLGTLLAMSATEEPEGDVEEEAFAAHVTWLAAHTTCDALHAVEAGVLERDALFHTLARIAVEPAAVASDFGRTEALVAAAALAVSGAAAAARERQWALERVVDPAVRALLGSGGAEEPLAGELVPAPFGPFLTFILALSLLLFVWQLGRLVARLAFAYRRPAVFRLSERGLELNYRVELLGRVLSERSALVPFGSIVRVARELVYARAGLYAGIVALVLGTYFGTGLFVDATRVPGGSLPLVGLAITFVVAGLLLDFVVSGGEDNLRGRCRLLVTPSRGPALCLAGVDPERADRMLAFITEVAREASTPPPASILPGPA
jgi:hypothetical protein